MTGRSWLVRKRFSHFVDLRKKLVLPMGWGVGTKKTTEAKLAIKIYALPFPKKIRFPGATGNPTVEQLVAARKSELASWTNGVLAVSPDNQDMAMFLAEDHSVLQAF
eukprot:SAG31_NODE_4159_length_3524_cov_2.556788_4_plen_107_part_00